MIINGVGKLLAKRICPNGEKELLVLGTLQDLRIDMNVEMEDVFGGDSMFAIDTIITSKAISITGTDAKFDLNTISLMMGSAIENGEGNAWVLDEKQVVQAGKTVVLKYPLSDLQMPYELAPEDAITLRLEKNNRVIPKEAFSVDTTGGITTLTITSTAVNVGDAVGINYQRKITNMSMANILSDEVPFPVHVIHQGSFQQKDGTKQAIETELYACRASGTFSINAQRATASTSAIDLQVIDPERPDGRIGSVKRYEDGFKNLDCIVDEIEWTEPPAIPDTYTITFNVSEPGATIVVVDSNSVVVGATSEGVYQLEPGEYTYTVSKDGYLDYNNYLIVTNKDEEVVVELELE